MSDDQVSAATLLDQIDLTQDDPQIVRTVFSILNAPDYSQLFATFHSEDPQNPPANAVKFVNTLDKVCVLSPLCPHVMPNSRYIPPGDRTR